MKNELSPERRRVVVLCAAVACFSGVPVLLRGHPALLGGWIGLMAATLIYAMVQLAKLKRDGK
jgi:hypothetical protein